MSDDAATDSPTGGWRNAAVARSLDPARARAEKRVQRFLDAALELMAETNDAPSKDFTVQQVVERSGQSLRSFYQYFAGKYELLLAIFEESVRWTADHLEELIAEEPDPGARLHLFAREYYRVCSPSPNGRPRKGGTNPAMAEFVQQLLTDHPQEASNAFIPLVSLLTGLLDQAAEAGAIRTGLDHRRIAGVVIQAIGFHLFTSTISGSSERADVQAAGDELWDLLLNGLAG